MVDHFLPDPDESRKKIEVMERNTKPIPTNPEKLQHYREGKFCGRCTRFLDLETGQRELVRRGFWEKAFTQFGDGSDWKPYHFGNLGEYSICKCSGAITNIYSPACGDFRDSKGFIARIFGGF